MITERYGDVLDNYISEFLETRTLSQRYSLLTRPQAQEILMEEHFLETLDMTTDDSMTKFVNPDVPFEELSYIPNDLEDIERDFVIDTKGNAQLRSEAREQFEKMAEAFF